MVVPPGQRAELLAEALAARIVLAAAAIAIAPPVAEGTGDPRQQLIFDDHGPALAHRDLMGRIKGKRRQIAEGADRLAVEGGPQGIAAVFDEPEIVLPAKIPQGGCIVRYPHGVGDHHGPRLRRNRRRHGLHAGDVGPQFHVDENRQGTILDDRVDGRGKAGGDGDHFIARPDAALLQLRRSQRAEGHEIGRRTGIDQQGRIATHALGQRPFELLGESAGGQPEIETGLDRQADFLRIEDPAGIANGRLPGDKRLRAESLGMVLFDELPNFCTDLIFAHNRCGVLRDDLGHGSLEFYHAVNAVIQGHGHEIAP